MLDPLELGVYRQYTLWRDHFSIFCSETMCFENINCDNNTVFWLIYIGGGGFGYGLGLGFLSSTEIGSRDQSPEFL